MKRQSKINVKKNSGLLILLVLFAASCASESQHKVKLEIPNVSPVPLEPYQILTVTDFLLEREFKDFDLSQELVNYLTAEFSQKFKGGVAATKIVWGEGDPFTNPGFWTSVGKGLQGGLLLTGKVLYEQDTRKAFLEPEGTGDDSPFQTPKSLSERKVFTLQIHLYLIKAETGEVVFDKEYKETKNYQNKKQTGFFAFFDLIQKVKTAFFRSLFGETRIQERYLLTK
jgi:hypothetical protein